MDPAPVGTVVVDTAAPPLEPLTGYVTAVSFALLFFFAVGILILVRLRKRGRQGVD